jgi:hypothetical protein
MQVRERHASGLWIPFLGLIPHHVVTPDAAKVMLRGSFCE